MVFFLVREDEGPGPHPEAPGPTITMRSSWKICLQGSFHCGEGGMTGAPRTQLASSSQKSSPDHLLTPSFLVSSSVSNKLLLSCFFLSDCFLRRLHVFLDPGSWGPPGKTQRHRPSPSAFPPEGALAWTTLPPTTPGLGGKESGATWLPPAFESRAWAHTVASLILGDLVWSPGCRKESLVG